MDTTWLWIPLTLVASCGQVARNTMQRRLVETIGTVGATQVRFLFGFPFSLLFLAGVLLATGEPMPRPGGRFWPFILLGAASQVGATALMLAAMRVRSFAVVTALVKTEPVQLALFGLVVLGDRLSPLAMSAVLVATVGVVACTWTPRIALEARSADRRTVTCGIAAGGLFALSAVGFRGAILDLGSGGFVLRATTALSWSLLIQTALLSTWLIARDRPALFGSFREWRRSLPAGFIGAAASQFWFMSFALTAAANVRTLALVEVLLAQAVAWRVFAQMPTRQELAAIALIVAGVLTLLLSH